MKVTITEDKSLVFGKVLVDDSPDYIRDWLKGHRHGWGILPAHPTNEGFQHPRAIRYDGSNGSAIEDCMRSVLA